ncbi:MAG: type II toxin-antitoxin system HicA family toxin [Candidatus Nealsonbacteria bacterium DGGOD1a]|jgi:Predicted periplasmic or secreted lipoprotein|nr:MAG: type II toxin-antitoxin system HicA family toxin [Candidatus Nealsonbacteria bacterium DGGOD1a]
MKNLPSLNLKQVIKALKKLGFEEVRQKGSHLVLYNQKTNKRTVVPIHAGKEIKKPLLKSIIETMPEFQLKNF